jgi:hypothetical protein
LRKQNASMESQQSVPGCFNELTRRLRPSLQRNQQAAAAAGRVLADKHTYEVLNEGGAE